MTTDTPSRTSSPGVSAPSSSPGTSPAPRTAVPGELGPQVPLDHDLLVPSVVHLTAGGPQRAHQAVCFEQLARCAISTDWGAVHVELPGGQAADEQADERADAAVVDTLAAPTTRLVTLALEPGDLSPAPHPGSSPGPRRAHELLVRALERRRRAGLAPFTVLSCDDVPHNGEVTREAVLALARRRDAGLAAWVEERGAFPASTLDHVAPPVVTEAQDGGREAATAPPTTSAHWVVEDRFSDGRPPLDLVGVRFTASTVPCELVRTRLLGGARCAVGVLGHLAGARTTAEALARPALRAFTEGFLAEAAALLLSVTGVDLEEYRAHVVERLADPGTTGPVPRPGTECDETFVAFVLPSLRQALDQNRPRHHLVLAVAAWLHALAEADGTDPRAPLARHEVFGTLSEDGRFRAELDEALELLRHGPLEAAAAIETTSTTGPDVRPATEEG